MKKLSTIFACCIVLSGLTTMAHAIENPNLKNDPNTGTYNRNQAIDLQNKGVNQDNTYYHKSDEKIKDKSDANQRNIKNQIPAEKKSGYLSLADKASSVVSPDQELTKKINDKIGSGWFSKGYEHVTVNVNNGVVTLGGSVKTQADKEKVEKEVRNLDGVKKLDSQIVVRDASSIKKDANKDFSQDTFSSAADEQLNKKIRDNVSRGWLWNDYEDVYLSTTNGVVTLNGEVDDRDDETKLLKEIQNVEGVKSVKSNLSIDNDD